MTEMFLTAVGYIGIVLIAWFVLALAIGLVVGKSVHLADERQAHPEPESLRDAA